jgi:hypothetical protein
VIEVLEFIFAGWGHFLGTLILIWSIAIPLSQLSPLIRVNIIRGDD